MAKPDEKREKVVTPVGRLIFPFLFKARPPMKNAAPGSKDKYMAILSFNIADIKKVAEEKKRWDNMLRIANDASKAKFGRELAKLPSNFKKPIRDGMEKENLEGFGEGTMFIQPSSFIKPGIVASDRVTVIDDAEGIYSGCYCRFSITAYAYDQGGGKGVNFGLQNVMFVRDGERLDERTDAAEDFGDLGEASEEEFVI